MRSSKALVAALCALFVATLGVRTALAMMGRPTSWPVDRMLVNVGRYVERHPEAAEAHYCLGRIHTYAFVYELAHLAVSRGPVGEESLLENLEAGRVTLDDLAKLVYAKQEWRGNQPRRRPEAQPEHLAAALRSLRRALELAPERGAFHLTLAYALERGAHLATHVDSGQVFTLEPLTDPDGEPYAHYDRLVDELGTSGKAETVLESLSHPTKLKHALPWLNRERASSNAVLQATAAKLLTRAWLDQSIAHYRVAFELAYEADRAEDVVHDYWGMTSLEAGEAYLRLSADRPELEADEAFRARVSSAVAELRQKPMLSSVTPILLSLEGCRSLEVLVSPERTVLFDLDGDLVVEAWPWPAPSAGWLVWDPKRKGRIESGRDLFGSASSWFFFPDGYRVLDALDDDGSGELRAGELAGIAVWFDRDTDGISDRGEVVPVEELGIVALATESTLTLERSPANLCGVELADGRVLPTYDWVLAPIAP